jgi:hypothetical protein
LIGIQMQALVSWAFPGDSPDFDAPIKIKHLHVQVGSEEFRKLSERLAEQNRQARSPSTVKSCCAWP